MVRDRVAATGRLVVVACAALGLAACRQILGLDVSPDGQGGSPADAGPDGPSICVLPSSGTAACAACTQAHCCAESSACAVDQVFCVPYETCLAGCKGDPACRSQCTIDHPVPATSSGPVSALSACLAKNCENECGLTCGAFAGYLSEPATSGACESCLEQNACTHARTCGTSADCDAYWRCVRACPTIDCKQACPQDHATGFAESGDLFNDFSGTCAQACGFGSYWACAGHIDYPVAKAAVTTWTNYVYDISDRLPVANATLLVCANCPCPTAEFPLLAQGTTNIQGYVTIPIPLNQASNGQAELFCIQTSAAGYDTTFFFPGIPYSEPSISITDALGPPVSLGLVLFSPMNIQKVITNLGGNYDPTRGMIAAGIFDCLANPANNVLVSIDSNDPMAVLAQPADAGAEAGLATLSGGYNTNGHAVFFNLAPRTYVLTATPPGLSKPVGQVTVTVAPKTVSQCGLFAGP